MPNSTVTTGYTAATPEHLLIDAGAVYKNYGLTEEAILGATSGGNEFDVAIKTRDIKVDGIKGTAKGLKQITEITITLKANMLEVTSDILKTALVGSVDTTTNPDYDIITSKLNIDDTDYLDNVALVGKLSGSGKPVVIILKNALSSDGLKVTVKDNSDNVLPITFTANVDPANPTVVPYEIHYPKLV